MSTAKIETYLRTHQPVFRKGFRHEITRASWPFHSHRDMEIAFFTRGRGRITFTDGMEFGFDPEGFVLIPPGLPHQTELELPAESAAILVELPEPVPELFGRAAYVPPCRDPQVAADVMYLTAPPPAMGPLQQLEFDLRTAALLSRLAQLIEQPDSQLDEAALYVGMAHAYLQRHFAETVRLEAVAEHVGISYDHLRHLFKERRGMSLKQFLTQLRITHARQLLLRSRMLVKEVAEACGFDSERHFSMYFKKAEGVSPGAYRKRHAAHYAAGFETKPRGAPDGVAPASQDPPECHGLKSREKGK